MVGKEGRRYGLTVRPTLTGPLWSVRHHRADGFETVATTGMAGTVLIGMRAHSAARDHRSTDEERPESGTCTCTAGELTGRSSWPLPWAAASARRMGPGWTRRHAGENPRSRLGGSPERAPRKRS